MSVATRRAALGAILAAPLTGGAVMALPLGSPPNLGPSDLVQACDWAVGQSVYIDTVSHQEHWDDDRLDEEMDRYTEVFRRAINEPSASPAGISAKARLLLRDLKVNTTGWHPDDESTLSDDDRLVRVVLREVIKLCA
ncbi:hypothetical protein MKK67_12345 [Methylobacterium sp. J-072]|uniref:hypothetical protein n=1 Tax=Methylobacterium sp. J-072 TaxID=2836651 RepID=UPI001FBA536A|nr:hypothetical protein [Methylobacterium sp. J-072]MCJ2093273.1 hypothetical protein [Methylobacterium sp. J-072]